MTGADDGRPSATRDQGAKPVEHFAHSGISMFQSAVAATWARHGIAAAPDAVAGIPPPADHASSMIVATARAARTLTALGPAAVAASLRQGVPMSGIDRCAHAYLALAAAEASGDRAAVARARADLPKFGQCDARWAEALGEFLLHAAFRRHGGVPYVPWSSLDDFTFPDPRKPGDASILPAKAKVAVFGDWGTGEARAKALLDAVARMEPDIVIHLGDIYYSCDLREADAFYRNVTAAFEGSPTRIFSLCGNHDMYSGGAPYYGLLTRLGQPASFFCLRNADWQLLAADTGYNDYDPFMEARSAPWVRDGADAAGRPERDPYSELAWHADKLSRAGGRKTVFMTHHPPFTRHSPIAGRQARNERLLGQFGPWLDSMALWLWGHEHAQIVYEPFAGIARGRCLGAGAIPTMVAEEPYDPGRFEGSPTLPGLAFDPDARLRVSRDAGMYDLGFGLLTLDGPAGRMAYFSFSEEDGPRRVHEEAL